MAASFYAERRARALDAIRPGVLVLASAPLAIRNNDVEHEYRQDSDFYYLTGFDEPESVLVLASDAEKRFSLFVRPRDPERETWDGARAGCEGAVTAFGADAAFPIAELDEKLPQLLENNDRLFYKFGSDRPFDDKVLAALDRARAKARKGSWYPRTFVDPGTVLHEMRRLKQTEEIAALEKAADVTREAHLEAMKRTEPGMYEFEIEALLRAIFRRRGSERPAYTPIVGSGPNATILHHRRNDRKMLDGDLLLIDAGCEFDYYASDVTRTFPVNGHFSAQQRAVYELVLRAQLASIERIRPGETLDAVHRESLRIITQGLIDLAFIDGPLDKALEEERFKRYFMHKTSHYLGMDVHDVGDYFIHGQHRPLQAGVIVTVEPGIYVPVADDKAPPEFRGIGVRIEDDVLVTSDGHRVLTADIPKTIYDVERACCA